MTLRSGYLGRIEGQSEGARSGNQRKCRERNILTQAADFVRGRS